MKMKKSVLLKVSAILCLIIGLITLISSVVAISVDATLLNYGVALQVVIVSIGVGFAEGAVALAGGICGVRNSRRPDMVSRVFTVAVILFAVMLIGSLIDIVLTPSLTKATAAMTQDMLASMAGSSADEYLTGSGFTSTTVVSAIVGAVIRVLVPLLYLIAAYQNREQVQDHPDGRLQTER